MGERGVCISLRFRYVKAPHWPSVAHHCGDPWCPQKVCSVCGKQARECVESQKDPKEA